MSVRKNVSYSVDSLLSQVITKSYRLLCPDKSLLESQLWVAETMIGGGHGWSLVKALPGLYMTVSPSVLISSFFSFFSVFFFQQVEHEQVFWNFMRMQIIVTSVHCSYSSILVCFPWICGCLDFSNYMK